LPSRQSSKAARLKKISVGQLRLGMHIHELCGTWMSHTFWRTRFVVTDPDDVRRVQESGIRELWIDIDKGIDVEDDTLAQTDVAVTETLVQAVEHSSQQPKATSMADELQSAAKTLGKAKHAVESMFQEVRMGRAIDAAAAGELVEEISASVMRNPGALISLARLKTADDYTYLHSVAVCALMVALARQLNLDDNEIRGAGMSGLLHDLGKAVMPVAVLNKPGKLTDEEFAIMKKHPEEGHRLLVEGGCAMAVVLDVCLHHHEKVDGSGYPQGLKNDQISLFAKMGAVCDIYDAITSNRPYKAGWDPAESIRQMTEWSKGHFDKRVFHAFVKSIGIYPIGSFVRMRSGRLGVVIDQTAKSLLTPKVKVFFSTSSNLRIPPQILDLSSPDTPDKIVAVEEPAKWNFNELNALWGNVELR
jgi:HD-GYP domain-containing protein (c-di-GMP phosphodiesterase class II)